MTVKPLTHTEVKNARTREKDYSIFDGFGLLLYVSSTGYKTWRFRYVHPVTNKRQTYSIGGYPQFSLAEARSERESLRKMVARGIDPNEVKKEKALEQRRSKAQTVEAIATEWFEMKKPEIRLNTQKTKKRFISQAIRLFGSEPLGQLKAAEVIERLRSYADRPHLRHGIVYTLNNIMDYAINCGLIDANPLAKIQKAFPALKRTQFPTLAKHELPQFLAYWNALNVYPAAKLVLKFQIATMVRPSEARQATWSEIDIDNRLWVIPAERMKSARPHIVPLSDYALAILAEAKKWRLSGSDFVFASVRKPSVSVGRFVIKSNITASEEYKGRVVPHGFRSLASTVLNEEGFHPDVIEAALAHKSGDAIRNIYNRTTYLEKRRVMMEWWGDFIEAAERGEILETTGDKGLRIVG